MRVIDGSPYDEIEEVDDQEGDQIEGEVEGIVFDVHDRVIFLLEDAADGLHRHRHLLGYHIAKHQREEQTRPWPQSAVPIRWST